MVMRFITIVLGKSSLLGPGHDYKLFTWIRSLSWKNTMPLKGLHMFWIEVRILSYPLWVSPLTGGGPFFGVLKISGLKNFGVFKSSG